MWSITWSQWTWCSPPSSATARRRSAVQTTSATTLSRPTGHPQRCGTPPSPVPEFLSEATQGPWGAPLASNDCKSGSTICSLTDRTCRPPEFVRKYPRNSQSKALVFDRDQLSTQARTGRFAEPQSVSDTPAIDRLAGFLGRCDSHSQC